MDPDLSRRWRGETPFVWDHRPAAVRGRSGEETAPPARPLIRPAPRSAMFFPLVVLVAVLPGLVALNAWDLTPPGPMWGLRGLAVLDGLIVDQVPAGFGIKTIREEGAYKAVAFQPPLYAWLESLGFWLSADHNPLASVLPSYVAGALAVVMVYLHGRLWRGAGLGLMAALLVGFNQSLLLRMQEATPTTLAVCGILAALLAYGWHERVMAESARPWSWGGPIMWSVAGGLALGLALLSLGGLALITIPIVVMHQYYQGDVWPRARARPWSLNRRDSPGLVDGLLALSIALGVALTLVRGDVPDPWLAGCIGAAGAPRWVGPSLEPAAATDRSDAGGIADGCVRGRASDPVGAGR